MSARGLRGSFAAGVVAGLVVVAGGAGLARAQLKDCAAFEPPAADPLRPAAYTMFLDDIGRRGHGLTAPHDDGGSLRDLINGITARILNDPTVQARRDVAPSAEWRTCVGRAPKLGDFVLRIRRDLFQYGVVLEVFGDSDGSRMELRHAIIPAMYELNGEVLQLDTLPLDDARDAALAFSRYGSRLQGYIEVAMALRLILAVGNGPDQKGQRQIARHWLCDGARLIFGGGGLPPAKLTPEQSALLEMLSRHMANLASAGADPEVRALLQHGDGNGATDATGLLKEACLGTRS